MLSAIFSRLLTHYFSREKVGRTRYICSHSSNGQRFVKHYMIIIWVSGKARNQLFVTNTIQMENWFTKAPLTILAL